MYNEVLPLRFDAVTPYASGDDDNKSHGMAITAELTVVEPDFYADLGLMNPKMKYLKPLLLGELPVSSDSIELAFSSRDGLSLYLQDDKLRVDCEVTKLKTTPLLGDHWDVRLTLKCPGISEKAAGILANRLRTLNYCTIEHDQQELFPKMEINIDMDALRAKANEESKEPELPLEVDKSLALPEKGQEPVEKFRKPNTKASTVPKHKPAPKPTKGKKKK